MPKKKKNRGLTGTQAASRKKGILARYNSLPEDAAKTKAIRSGVDIAGALASGALASIIGRNAALFGLGVLITGNIVKDKSGLCRVIGAGMLSYGVAKVFENISLNKQKSVQGFTLAGAAQGAKERVTQYKDELLSAFYLDRLFKKNPSTDGEDSDTVEGLDLASLDFFDENNHQEALEYESSREEDDSDELPEPQPSYMSSGSSFSYTIENDLPDVSQL